MAVAAFAGDRRFLPPLLEHVTEPDGLPRPSSATWSGCARLDQDPCLVRSTDAGGKTALRYCCESRLGAEDPAAEAALTPRLPACW